MKLLRIIPLLVCLPALQLSGQSTVTAASSSYTDVNAVINGPTHVAVNGDTIQIPCSSPTSVMWSSTLTINANITLTALGATPHTGASTFGAGMNCLTIIANTGTLIHATPTYNATNNLLTIQNMTIRPGAGAISSCQCSVPIQVNGTGTSSGMPQLRVDNVQFGDSTATWQYGNASSTTGEFAIVEDNTFGVADHNTLYGTAGGSPLSHVSLISVNLTSYLGLGLYGDNSWAQPDSMGDITKAFYVENNQTYQQLWPIQETEQQFPNIGGARAVVRFNHSTMDGTFGYTGGHGWDTDGRPRSVRHVETYGNTLSCINGPGGNQCYDLAIDRGGTIMVFGNTGTVTGTGTNFREMIGLSTLRQDGDGWTNVNIPAYGITSPIGGGSCGAGNTFLSPLTSTGNNAVGPFDLDDGSTYATGTFTSGTSGTHIVDSSKSWSTNQWSAPGDHFPYSIWDKTQGWVSYVTANGSNNADVFQAPHGYINGGTFINAAAGDQYEIHRSKGCVDGAAMGQSALLQGTPPVLASTGNPGPANPKHDPFYEWDNSMQGGLSGGAQVQSGYAPAAIANLTYFTDNSLGSPQVQTSPSSPFNGTSGVGFGTLANRPTTCTANTLAGVSGVGYFATDQGSWNTSGNGFGQGILYDCSATNTWTAYYTPGCYPHPLAGGSCGGTSYTLTVAATNGSVSGSNCSSATYASGTSIGACTATPNAGYTFTGWSGGGCSGTGSCTFPLTGNTTLTATFTASTASLTVTATNGSVSGTNCSTGSYTSGTSIGACTATPNTGYTFTGWSSTGSAFCSGTGTCGPFSLTTATTLTASFAVANYTVSTASSGTGSGTITGCAGTHHYSDPISCTVTPNAGSTVTTVTGGGGTWTSSPYTFTMPASNVTVTATFKGTAATPTFSPVAGSYATAQSVTISDTTPGSTILYTNDGSTPACPSTGTTYTTPVSVSSSLTLKAIACASGWTDSAVGSAAYTIAACTVSFSPSAGTYTSGQTVTISTSGCLAGTQVFYRTDGLPATNIDTQYTVPIVVPVTQTLTAKAVLSPTVRDQPQTISTQKKCNAVGSPITFPSGYSCTNGSGGVAGTASDFKFTAGTLNQMYVSTTDATSYDTSVLLIDTPTAVDNSIVAMSHREVFQDSTNCSQAPGSKYKCVDVSEMDSESCCDTVTHALWQMSVRCSTNVAGSSGNNGFLEGDASSGSEKWDIPCVIGAATDLTVNSHWTQHDTGCAGSGCMVLDSIYLNGTKYAFPASCDSGDANCPSYPMTPQPTYGNFIAGSQDQIYARNVGVAGTSPLTTTRNISFARVGVDEGTEATGSAAYVITPSSSGSVTLSGSVKISGTVGVQ